ncbi:hypothetical protein [Paenibacillus sp. Z3-2]
MFKKYIPSKIILCLTLMFALPYQIAGADSVNGNKLDQIVSLHENGLTREELQETILEISQQQGVSQEKITNQILQELQVKQLEQTQEPLRTAKSTKDKVQVTEPDVINPFSDSGSDGNYQLNESRKGTFFYQPASTLGLPHGHIGMYYTKTTIIEAANPNDGVRSASVANRKVSSGSRIMSTTVTTITKDEAAANWAYGKKGNSYNNNFVSNRSCDGSKFNCSQLVWCAFKQAANIDLDKDGGWGVYPVDIRDHKNVYDIKVY